MAKKATDLDPGSSIIGVSLAGAYWNQGLYSLAQRVQDIHLDEALPAVMEHPDAFSPEICYLTSGDTEKALASLETPTCTQPPVWLGYRPQTT